MSATHELMSFAGFICRSIDRLVACLDGLTESEAHWRPPAAGANSLIGLATHVMGNAEENLLSTLAALQPAPARQGEFDDAARTADAVRAAWAALRPRLEAAIQHLPPAELDHVREHPRRGRLTGRDVLIVVARHAAEHMGQAELTRDLIAAARG